MTIDEQNKRIDTLLDMLAPCLKREKHGSGHLYYPTEYGFKSREGLRALIRRTLFDPGENERIAPFPVKAIPEEGRYQAKLSDISTYLKEWSHGQVAYADSRYVAGWLERIGLHFSSLELSEDEETFETLVSWIPEAIAYIPVSWADAWKEDRYE